MQEEDRFHDANPSQRARIITDAASASYREARPPALEAVNTLFKGGIKKQSFVGSLLGVRATKEAFYLSVLHAFNPAHLFLVRVYLLALLEQSEELRRVPCSQTFIGGAFMNWPARGIAGPGLKQ